MNNTKGNYATIDKLRLYYEIHGSGFPLVLIHGGGSTIESSFGRILPMLARSHQVIAVELQAHGRTLDIDRPLSFEQDADDVAALLAQLHIESADVMGFSNGATTTLQVAIRHPKLIHKTVLCSTTYKQSGMIPGFFDGFEHPSMDMMPEQLKKDYLNLNPDPNGLQRMFDRDVARMKAFKDIPDDAIRAIQSPALIINGDRDVVLPEHAMGLFRLLPHAQLAILPAGHGDYLGESTSDPHNNLPLLVVELINNFLKS